MKSKSLSTKLIFVFLFLAVATYFLVQGYRYFAAPQTIVLAYPYTAEDSIETYGYFVRDEKVVSCSETLLELERTEGERVPKNGLLATVYQSRSALDEHDRLRELQERQTQLLYAQSTATDSETLLKLDGSIRSELLTLRTALAGESFSAAEDAADELRSLILKREFVYSDSDETKAQLKALADEINMLSSGLSGAAQQIRSPEAGVYSAVVDGYEDVLNSNVLKKMRVSDFDALRAHQVISTVGKMISGDVWYFVCVLSEEDAARIRVGGTLTLHPSSDTELDLAVTVERIGDSEDGRCLVVLSGSRYLASITMLRHQNAALTLCTYSGLRIPKNALRVTDEGVTGVYCRVGLRAYFKPVRVLWQDSDFCLVEPEVKNASSESQEALYTLRTNDEVIISANDLYNGKVIE